ncbi:MAG: hypothetical protein LBH12_07005 [Dysgonamonadaceae bacterium]|jgi:uncharacterized protein involved in exopolysaccharide biosynthesis|nr:hypothetical protein [Dysgonamonadaceae bacterium]
METTQNKTELEQLKDIFFNCLRNWPVFIVSFAVCSLLGAVYYLTADKVFQVNAQVSIRHDESLSGAPMSSSGSSSLMSVFGFGRGSSANIEDETLKLQSHGYIKNIVKKQSLNFNYTKKKFGGFSKTPLYDQSPVTLKTDDTVSDTITGGLTFQLKVTPEEVKVKVKRGFKTLGNHTLNSFPGIVQTPFGDFELSQSPYFNRYEYPMNISVSWGSFDYWTQIYQNRLEVDFEKKTSDIIHLSMKTDNIPFSKKFIAEVIDVYNEEWDKDKKVVSNKTVDFLNTRIAESNEKLNDVDKQILDFKKQHNLTEIEADVKMYLTQSAEIQAAFLEAKTQLDLVDMINKFVEDPANKNSLIPFSLSTADPAFAGMITVYNEEVVRRKEFALGTENLPGAYDESMNMYRRNLIESLNNVRKGLKITVDNIKNKENELSRKIGDIPQIEKNYVQLRREQELQQEILIFLLEMKEQVGAKGITLLPKLKVMDQPYVLNKPVSPNLMKISFLIVLFGGVIIPAVIIYNLPKKRLFVRKK